MENAIGVGSLYKEIMKKTMCMIKKNPTFEEKTEWDLYRHAVLHRTPPDRQNKSNKRSLNIILCLCLVGLLVHVGFFSETFTLPRILRDSTGDDDQVFNKSLDEQFSNNSNSSRRRKLVTILMWTTFYGNSMVHRESVPQSSANYRCRITDNKTLASKADAIVFHIRDFNFKNLPKIRHWWQYYVFFLKESPYHTHRDLRRLNGFFNLTMTYRKDSDIFSGAQFLERKDAPTNYSAEELMANISSLVVGKTKLIAWFVSNCNTPSKRGDVVRKLQSYIPVDIYGSCGKLTCPRTDSTNCDRMLSRDYKFYVAFENSACVDYVTEKFFRLRLGVVPLVLRAADYRHIAPASTYIAVDQFPSIKHLADYLLYLDKNNTAYIKYFAWQMTMYLTPMRSYAELCRNLALGKYPTRKIYDIHEWWHGRSDCVDGIGTRLAARKVENIT